MAEVFNRPIEIYVPGNSCLKVGESSIVDSESPPIMLSYHNNNHYNSVHHINGSFLGFGISSKIQNKVDQIELDDGIEESIKNEIENDIVKQTKLDSEQEQISDDITSQIIKESQNELEDDAEIVLQKTLLEYYERN